MAKTKSKIDTIAKLLVKQLENMGIRVRQLILFGSYATGKPNSYSDIDIAVVSDSFEDKGILKRQELLGEAIYPLGEPIEAIGYTTQEYRKATSTSFLWEIITTGKVIYKSSA